MADNELLQSTAVDANNDYNASEIHERSAPPRL